MPLTIEGLGHVYGAGTGFASPALEGVTLTLEPGEVVVVLGPTGSGKSTLLRAAAGLIEPTRGRVTVDGRGVPAAGLVGLVFQQPEAQLFAETVADDVAFGPRNLGLPQAEVAAATDEALRAVGLDPDVFGQRSPFTLSGGEARRAALAGVLAMRPRYLLLDEPSSGLDAEGRERLRTSILAMRERAGVVIVTHDAEEFLPLADRALVLAGGRPAFLGGIDELLVRACEVFDRAGLLAPEVVRAQLLAGGGAAPVLDAEEAAERLAALPGGGAG